MNKFFLLLIVFSSISCTSPYSKNSTNSKTFDFSKNLNFDEFNELLIQYAEISPYPNIDQ
jgi:hypothetical protein